MTRVLDANGLYRFFHDGDVETVALRDVSLAFSAGEFVALTGPSGSGKSTLLSCLAGLDDPDGGTVDVMGQRMSHRPEAHRALLRRKHVGMLMQRDNLFDHLTVEGNVRLQRGLSGHRQPVAPMLAAVGLSARAAALPRQLSGGEAARAAFCVALTSDPAVLLCDEPTAEVDSGNERAIIELIDARRRHGTAVLVATHSVTLARRADRVIEMCDGRLL